jgi:hypothetical protein
MLQPKKFSDLQFMLLLVRTHEGFKNIVINKHCHASSGETLSSSRVLSLSSYILSRLSMIASSNVGVLTYIDLHLYPHMTNPTDRCSFSYLVNFMPAVVGLALSNYVALFHEIHFALKISVIYNSTADSFILFSFFSSRVL